jgi:hypothetical protein
MLGVGEVRVLSSSLENMAEYRLRNKELLLKHIIPLFDQNPLLTSKQYNYELFKKALLISTNSSVTKIEKHILLTELKKQLRPVDYISSS